ncbi:MAG TPA: hypothetical protein VM266_05765 [Solirubrobacteraceae bacterium]|nr:hypothetical protein [Solirubrobacteraceae bacterium]
MAWLETASEHFVARHAERDAPDVEHVLAQLEAARTRYERRFGGGVGELAVVLHGAEAQLDAAEPWLPLQRRLTAPAGRRYLVGWAGERELHVLSPRALARRASNVEGSLEMLMLAPSALLARRFVAAHNPGLPPPFGPRAFARYLRWAWLVEGAAQWLSGQTRHARPAIARRLREGGPPAFPPSRRDAPLLGGSVFDLLAREEGEAACVALARAPLGDGPERALERAFHGRELRHTEATWRAHLARLAEPGAAVRRN